MIYKSCKNCEYIDRVSDNCIRYPSAIPIPDDPCGEYVCDFDSIRIGFAKYIDLFKKDIRGLSKEVKSLKKEIKRLGGNPRKLGV